METIDSVKEFFEANKTKAPFAGKSLKDVKTLSGGLVNYVYRLEFDDGSTVILKYYPRYLSSDKTVEMSQNRYFVEKISLTLLGEQPWTKHNPKSMIRTPKVLLSDDANFVLVMEDAGPASKTLLDHLKNDENLIGEYSKLSQIAKDIHEFCDFVSNKSEIHWETHSNELENRPASQIIGGYVCRFCVHEAKRLNVEHELEGYLKLINTAFRTFEDQELVKQLGLRKVFAFGDLWPNSILVDSERNFLWVIDWEMARFETPTRDLEQLMANLWVMKQNDELFNTKSIETLMKRLQFEFFGDEDKDWREHTWKYGKETFVLWITTLVRERHWRLSDQRAAVLNAVKEVEKK